jgi:hypothetical protein
VNLVGLFPTIVNMAPTPAGVRVKPYVDVGLKFQGFISSA